MQAELPSRIMLGDAETDQQRTFMILSAAALLNIVFLISYALSANWWESGGLPVMLGILLLTGVLGGTREYGFFYSLVPAYLFLVPIVQWAYLMSDFGSGQIIRKILVTTLLPLLISLPLVTAGYLIGIGIHLLSGNSTPVSGEDGRV